MFKDYWRHCSCIHCFVGAFESLWSYMQTDATLLANNSQHCLRLHVAWKSQLNAGFLKWTMLLERTNLHKTVFQDLRYFGNLVPRLGLGGNLDLNKRFDAWGKFLTMNSRWWSAGFDTFWSASRWGIWPSKLPTYPGIWSDSQGSARGHGQFCYWLVHYVCDPTQANRELKAWFPYDRYDLYARPDCCDRWEKSSAIAAIIAIIWKPDFSEFAATTIAEIEPPFHVV